jgi:hypothetical protein
VRGIQSGYEKVSLPRYRRRFLGDDLPRAERDDYALIEFEQIVAIRTAVQSCGVGKLGVKNTDRIIVPNKLIFLRTLGRAQRCRGRERNAVMRHNSYVSSEVAITQ